MFFIAYCQHYTISMLVDSNIFAGVFTIAADLGHIVRGGTEGASRSSPALEARSAYRDGSNYQISAPGARRSSSSRAEGLKPEGPKEQPPVAGTNILCATSPQVRRRSYFSQEFYYNPLSNRMGKACHPVAVNSRRGSF